MESLSIKRQFFMRFMTEIGEVADYDEVLFVGINCMLLLQYA